MSPFLSNEMRSCAWILAAFSIFAPFAVRASNSSQEETGPVFEADEVVLITGGTAAAESEARPLLESDIKLELMMMRLMREHRPAAAEEAPPTAAEWRRAADRAAVIRILADQARRLHETPQADEKKALLGDIINRMGGFQAVNSKLVQYGIERAALHLWVENAVLAAGQLRFLKEQAMPVHHRRPSKSTTKPDNEATVPVKGDDLRTRIEEIIRNHHVRVVR